MKIAIIVLATGLLLFEFIEHVIFPLIWLIKDRKRKSICGATGMLGKKGKIKHWQKSKGQVFVDGELWRAVSDSPLSAGDSVVVQDVDGLTLCVIPAEMDEVDKNVTR